MSAIAILRAVASEHGLAADAIKGGSRSPRIVQARIEIAQRLRHERRLSAGQIGIILNKSDWQVRYYWNPKYRTRKKARMVCRWHLARAA